METIEVTESVKRIDGYLIEKLGVSRNKIQKMIEEKSILVNGKKVKNSTSLKTGDVIS